MNTMQETSTLHRVFLKNIHIHTLQNKLVPIKSGSQIPKCCSYVSCFLNEAFLNPSLQEFATTTFMDRLREHSGLHLAWY